MEQLRPAVSALVAKEIASIGKEDDTWRKHFWREVNDQVACKASKYHDHSLFGHWLQDFVEPLVADLVNLNAIIESAPLGQYWLDEKAWLLAAEVDSLFDDW
jgi:hypothetical protein